MPKASDIDVDIDFGSRLAQIAETVENALISYLRHDGNVPPNLYEAMVYSLKAGGKRLRPAVVILACQGCGGSEGDAVPAAAAMEMIHTYSLIHDDLPAMDDDDVRRGRPSNHKAFGEGMAILAGDGLLTYAFNVLARHVENDGLTRQLVLELSQAAGAAGMIGGQAVDLQSPDAAPDLETLRYIHKHKTAMLFRAAGRMGAISAGAEVDMVESIGEYGLKLGLAFQIIDDVLDVTGDPAKMGKATQKDAEIGKLTYPAMLGLEQTRRQGDAYFAEALAAIEQLGSALGPLRQLAIMAANRKK